MSRIKIEPSNKIMAIEKMSWDTLSANPSKKYWGWVKRKLLKIYKLEPRGKNNVEIMDVHNINKWFEYFPMISYMKVLEKFENCLLALYPLLTYTHSTPWVYSRVPRIYPPTLSLKYLSKIRQKTTSKTIFVAEFSRNILVYNISFSI